MLNKEVERIKNLAEYYAERFAVQIRDLNEMGYIATLLPDNTMELTKNEAYQEGQKDPVNIPQAVRGGEGNGDIREDDQREEADAGDGEG